MPRSVFILFLLLASLFLTACAHKRPGSPVKTGDSIEFRLQCVESSLMEMQRQQERDRQYIASLEAKLRAMGQTPVRPAPVKPAGLPQKAAPATDTPPARVAPKTQPSRPRPTAPKTKAPVKKTPAAKPKTASPPAKPASTRPKSTPAGKGAYQKAMSLIRAGKRDQGRSMLRTILAEHPDSPYKPDALYAIGQTFFDEAVYDNAILAYKDVAGNFPSHPQAPDAMLQIGRCYEQLADPSNARFYLQALVDEYPASGAAKQAKTLLAKLSGRPGSAP